MSFQCSATTRFGSRKSVSTGTHSVKASPLKPEILIPLCRLVCVRKKYLSFSRVRVSFGPKATLGIKFSACPHIYASLLPLIIFTIAHILSIGESPPPISLDFDHVLFGTLSVEIRHCPPLRFSSSFPRALPSAFGGPLSGAEVPEIYFYGTSLFSHGCEPKCCSDNREAERKA